MLRDRVLIGDNLPDSDKQKIYNSVNYLSHVGGLDRLEFLPEDFGPGVGFEKTFGFDPFGRSDIDDKTKGYWVDSNTPIKTAEYDYVIKATLYARFTDYYVHTLCSFIEGQKEYELKIVNGGEVLLVLASGDTELLRVSVQEIFNAVNLYPEEKGEIDADKLTFDFENSAAKIKVVIRRSIYEEGSDMETFILFSKVIL